MRVSDLPVTLGQMFISLISVLLQHSLGPGTMSSISLKVGQNTFGSWRINRLFSYSGDKYWGFNPISGAGADNPPLPISQWYGLPTKGIDAVFTSPAGPTYFFQGDNYWLFDDDNFQVI